MSLMQLFADPSKFDSLTIGEKIIGSLVTGLLGMGTTFVVLILIWGFISLTGKMVHKEKTTSQSEPTTVPVVAPTLAPAPANEDTALIAVIMAAIYAAEGTAAANNLVVRKIRRIPGPDPVWSNAGRQESLDSRRV